MKTVLTSVLLLAFITGCNAQNNKKINSKETTGMQQGKPGISWKVNKKYDDKGNMVSYDSTAVWSYSSGQDERHVEADSVMMAFRKQFDSGFPSIFRENFGDPVWNDSLFYRDFTAPDYFMQKWEQHYFNMGKMMQRMDSLRNSFLNRNYPGLSPAHKD